MPIEPIFDSIIQQSLRYVIIDHQYIYIDLWSLIHFSSGIILGMLLGILYKKRHSWIIALSLLVGYEILELFLIGILFVGETKADVAWDLIIGMAGFTLSYSIIKKKNNNL